MMGTGAEEELQPFSHCAQLRAQQTKSCKGKQQSSQARLDRIGLGAEQPPARPCGAAGAKAEFGGTQTALESRMGKDVHSENEAA